MAVLCYVMCSYGVLTGFNGSDLLLDKSFDIVGGGRVYGGDSHRLQSQLVNMG